MLEDVSDDENIKLRLGQMIMFGSWEEPLFVRVLGEVLWSNTWLTKDVGFRCSTLLECVSSFFAISSDLFFVSDRNRFYQIF